MRVDALHMKSSGTATIPEAPTAVAATAARTGSASRSRQRGYDDPRWRLVLRMTSSRSLGRSELLSNFLLFVCDRFLDGREDEINEQQIGIHVFGRSAGFNTAEDNIVRSYARLLRRRIQDYFEQEGQDEPLRLEIPRGGYLPLFTELATAPETQPEDEEEYFEEPVELQESSWMSRHRGVLLAVVFTALLLGALGFWLLPRYAREQSSAQLHHRFWSLLFEPGRDTFIVPADSGLVLLQSFAHEPITLENFADGSYRQMPRVRQNLNDLAAPLSKDQLDKLAYKVQQFGDRRYTSLADLEMTARLARLPEVKPDRMLIRFARDLRLDDLRSSNAILIGSIDANPWDSLFQKQLNFQFVHDPGSGSTSIVNRHPHVGERARYAAIPDDPEQHTYGVIAFVPNLEGSGHVLLIQGLNMASTEAAGAILLDAEEMDPLLRASFSRDGAAQSFEILFETDAIRASASRPHILGTRVGGN